MIERDKPTYAGIPREYGLLERAKAVLLPVPYDGTSTWGKGADQGPEAFLRASENMELYDIETGTEPYRQGIYLADALLCPEDPAAMVGKVEAEVTKYLDAGKYVTLFGGEHSISIGSIRAFRKKWPDLSVLQIDAHADLRKEYGGTPFNHACAVYEARYTTRLVQVGIRSMDYTELAEVVPENMFYAHELDAQEEWMDRAIGRLGREVFITFDLDALDPSLLPSTGTPEPGGLQWYPTLRFLRKVFEQREVVGFDLVELCPNPSEPSSDFTAAKLYYKMLSYAFLGGKLRSNALNT